MRALSVLTTFAFLFCFSGYAADLPVPEELIGSETVGIVSIDVASLKPDQIVKTLTAILGQPPEPNATKQFADFHKKFTSLGGQTVNVVLNVDKNVQAATAGDGAVLVIEKDDAAPADKITAFLAESVPGFKDHMAPECPKVVDDMLVWYNKGFKLPAADEKRAVKFTDAFFEIGDDQSISIVFVPDENLVNTAQASLKSAKPEDAEMANTLMKGKGLDVYTDFGIADKSVLKVLLLAADEKSAGALFKTADTVITEFKKSAPPAMKSMLDGLKTVQTDANVEISMGVQDLATVVKGFADVIGALVSPPGK